MISWLNQNAGTIIVSAILLAVVALAVAKLVKNKRRGKSSCGCGCGECPLKDKCRK